MVIDFIKEALKEGFEVVATAVDYDGVDMKKQRSLPDPLVPSSGEGSMKW